MAEHPVLNGQGLQLAGADAEKGEGFGRGRLGDDGEAAGVAPGLPQPLVGRKQIALPALGSEGDAEQGLAAFHQPVTAAPLLVDPAGGQVTDILHRLVDDGSVHRPGADHPVAGLPQGGDQAVQAVTVDDGLVFGRIIP